MCAEQQFAHLYKLGRSFDSMKELCEAINRERCYVSQCLNGHKEFTEVERILLLRYLGEPLSKMNEFFPGHTYDGSISHLKDRSNEKKDEPDKALLIIDHLKDLSKLYKDGIITDSEFRELKKRIL